MRSSNPSRRKLQPSGFFLPAARCQFCIKIHAGLLRPMVRPDLRQTAGMREDDAEASRQQPDSIPCKLVTEIIPPRTRLKPRRAKLLGLATGLPPCPTVPVSEKGEALRGAPIAILTPTHGRSHGVGPLTVRARFVLGRRLGLFHPCSTTSGGACSNAQRIMFRLALKRASGSRSSLPNRTSALSRGVGLPAHARTSLQALPCRDLRCGTSRLVESSIRLKRAPERSF
ncbi:hypothetical protein C8Q76DRAFT_139516 [Earliella scabrosa]|nr:hypothetical protein C8Q76DRAFT_139516 [Earliella scabrosa]